MRPLSSPTFKDAKSSTAPQPWSTPTGVNRPVSAAGAPSGQPQPDCSHDTLCQYLNKGRELLNRYRRHIGYEIAMEDIDPVEFVNWLISLKPTLQPSTWRFYRVAVDAVVEALPHHETATALDILEADRRKNVLDALSGNARGRISPRRTSGKKVKRLPHADFQKLLRHLRDSRKDETAQILRDWLLASIWTGLRPTEWKSTALKVQEDVSAPFGRRARLHVINAKASNGRSNGTARTLDLTLFSDSVLESIERTSLRGSRWSSENRYALMQKKCSSLLYRVCQKVFPRRRTVYSFYSCRHQFVANMKSILPPEELSALLGHCVTDTAQEHYGRRKSAWKPDAITERPIGIPEEIATVRQRMTYSEKRVRAQEEGGQRPTP